MVPEATRPRSPCSLSAKACGGDSHENCAPHPPLRAPRAAGYHPNCTGPLVYTPDQVPWTLSASRIQRAPNPFPANTTNACNAACLLEPFCQAWILYHAYDGTPQPTCQLFSSSNSTGGSTTFPGGYFGWVQRCTMMPGAAHLAPPPLSRTTCLAPGEGGRLWRNTTAELCMQGEEVAQGWAPHVAMLCLGLRAVAQTHRALCPSARWPPSRRRPCRPPLPHPVSPTAHAASLDPPLFLAHPRHHTRTDGSRTLDYDPAAPDNAATIGIGVGVAVGGSLLLAALATGAFLLHRRRKRRAAQYAADGGPPLPPDKQKQLQLNGVVAASNPAYSGFHDDEEDGGNGNGNVGNGLEGSKAGRRVYSNGAADGAEGAAGVVLLAPGAGEGDAAAAAAREGWTDGMEYGGGEVFARASAGSVPGAVVIGGSAAAAARALAMRAGSADRPPLRGRRHSSGDVVALRAPAAAAAAAVAMAAGPSVTSTVGQPVISFFEAAKPRRASLQGTELTGGVTNYTAAGVTNYTQHTSTSGVRFAGPAPTSATLHHHVAASPMLFGQHFGNGDGAGQPRGPVLQGPTLSGAGSVAAGGVVYGGMLYPPSGPRSASGSQHPGQWYASPHQQGYGGGGSMGPASLPAGMWPLHGSPMMVGVLPSLSGHYNHQSGPLFGNDSQQQQQLPGQGLTPQQSAISSASRGFGGGMAGPSGYGGGGVYATGSAALAGTGSRGTGAGPHAGHVGSKDLAAMTGMLAGVSQAAEVSQQMQMQTHFDTSHRHTRAPRRIPSWSACARTTAGPLSLWVIWCPWRRGSTPAAWLRSPRAARRPTRCAPSPLPPHTQAQQTCTPGHTSPRGPHPHERTPEPHAAKRCVSRPSALKVWRPAGRMGASQVSELLSGGAAADVLPGPPPVQLSTAEVQQQIELMAHGMVDRGEASGGDDTQAPAALRQQARAARFRPRRPAVGTQQGSAARYHAALRCATSLAALPAFCPPAGATAVVFKCRWPSRFGPGALLAAKCMRDPYAYHMHHILESFKFEVEVLAKARCAAPPTRRSGRRVAPPRLLACVQDAR